MKFTILVSLVFLFVGIESSKILVLFPTISKSHIMPLQSLAVILAQRGHDITFVSTYPLGKQVKNYRDIEVPFDDADKEFIAESMDPKKSQNFISVFSKALNLVTKVTNNTLQMKEMKKMMKEESFDLVIVGYFFATENMLGVADHFKCPSILFSPAGNFPLINEAMGNPLAVAGSPHPMLSVKQMDFSARLMNFFAAGVDILMTKYFEYKSKQVYNFNFPADRYRTYEESLRNVSLSLVNAHFSSGTVRPQLPNVIEVGGMQVKPKASPLPESLKTFLDSAKDGAILFSLGSNAKSTFLAKETLATILNAFGQLKNYKIVMKWEADTLEGKPENVFISKWLPQDDVLAHPNIKAFISHCGFGGVVESKYHGVPIVGLPLFADQDGNAAKVVKEGWGVQLDIKTMTVHTMKEAVVEVLTNPQIIATAKKASELAQDRPMNAQDTAAFWVEYVIRHRGAPHMHYPGADLNFFQKHSIDVIFFLLSIIYAIFKALIIICKKICCRRKKSTSKKLKTK